MITNTFISKKELPSWFKYPEQFNRICELGLINIDPWIILENDQLQERYKGLKERYPDRSLIPFARREDNDDVACWEKSQGRKIIIIHDFASPGYENKMEYSEFWDWFRAAVEDMIEHD